MPIVELVTFQGSDAYIADPAVIKGALDIISKAPGFLRGYTGQQLEDKKIYYLAAEWESLEAHTKFTETPGFVEGSALLKLAFGGPPSAQHIAFEGDYTVAFNAPVTEVALVTLKEDKSKEDLGNAVDGLFAGALNDVPGVHLPGTRGEVVETPRSFYLTAGWDSLEAHVVALTNEKVQPFVGKLAGTLAPGFSMAHAIFKQL